MKKNVYLFEIEDVLANQAKLPYRTGLIWSYCLEHEEIRNNYHLAGWYWYRDQINSIENVFSQIQDPSLVAFSCFVWNWNWNMEMAKKIKNRWPKCIILIGGWQPPIADRSLGFFQKHSFIDIICHGEGEVTTRDILLEILKKEPKFESIKGCSMPVRLISYKQNVEFNYIKDGLNIIEKKIIQFPNDLDTYVSEPRPRIDHLALMPSPYLNGLFDNLIKNCPYDLEATIETTRGCPFGCTFCEIGTKYYQKIKTPEVEKVFKEIDWLAKNKIIFVYNADSNFGMLPTHIDIAEYLIKKKRETGYPQKHRVDWAKIHGDRVIELAKMFYNAGMDKGITIALQSMNPETLVAIKRKNMDDGKLADFLKKYNQAELPSYMELILGLPEESTETFIDGVCKIMDLGQHNYIGIYPLTALPNTPFGDPEYIKKFNLNIIETFPAFSHLDTFDQNNFEREKMVVGNTRMSTKDYTDATLWRWLFMFGHYLGYTQYLARFLNVTQNLSFKEFYSSLMDFIKNSNKSKFLKKEYSETYNSIVLVLECKGPWGRAIDSVRKNFSWDFEEATAIEIINNEDIFYNEIKDFMKIFNLQKNLLEELLEFQKYTLVNPLRNYPIDIKFSYNFYDIIFLSSKMLEKQESISIQAKNYEKNIFEWGKETLWWGRRVAANKAKIKKDFRKVTKTEGRVKNSDLFDIR